MTTFRRFKVFSTKKVSFQAVDTEGAPKKYWLVESNAKSALTIRPLDDQTWLPTGRPHPITVRELQKRYTPEPGVYEQRVQPNIERQANNLPLLAIPVAQDEALPPIDETAFTADFQQGIELLEQGNLEKATALFDKLISNDGPFEEKHKHMFNECAIQLRKSNLPSQAIAFYSKALELTWSDEDENLHINLARVLYAEKQYAGCVQHLFDALRIAPGHRVARSFLAWLEQQKAIPKQYALQVRGCLMQKSSPDDAPQTAPDTADETPTDTANDDAEDIMQGGVTVQD